jgi:uncharacterized protein (TIGR00304 family)
VTIPEILYSTGFVLILVGVAILTLAILLLSTRSSGNRKVKAGGAVIIGPVPIIFGTDKKSLKTVLLLSIVLTVLVLVAFIVEYFLLR